MTSSHHGVLHNSDTFILPLAIAISIGSKHPEPSFVMGIHRRAGGGAGICRGLSTVLARSRLQAIFNASSRDVSDGEIRRKRS